jgi:hypothetical protein
MVNRIIVIVIACGLSLFACMQPQEPGWIVPPPSEKETGKVVLHFKFPPAVATSKTMSRAIHGAVESFRIWVFNDSFSKDQVIDRPVIGESVTVEFVVPAGVYIVEAGAYAFDSPMQPLTYGMVNYGYTENVTVSPNLDTEAHIVMFTPRLSLVIQDTAGNDLTELLSGQTIRVKAVKENLPAFTGIKRIFFELFVGDLFHASQCPEDYLFGVPIKEDEFTTLVVPQVAENKTCVSVLSTTLTHYSSWANYSHQPDLVVKPTGTVTIFVE